jgi:LPS-assembly protein
MLDRLFLVFLLAILQYSSSSIADNANWNCQQDAKTKEWNCVGSSAANSEGSSTAQSPPDTESVKPYQSNALDIRKDTKNKPTLTPSETKTIEAIKGTEKYETGGNKNEALALPSAEEKPVSTVTGKAEQNEINLISQQPVKPVEPIAETPPKVLSANEKPLPSHAKPSSGSDIKPKGWACDNKGDEGAWNCQLTGVDPKGETHVVETDEQQFHLFDPTFNSKEESVFFTLRDRFKSNPWGNCTIQLGTQEYYLPDKKLRAKANVDMDSNYAEFYDNEIGTYEGSVEMKRADQRASANKANYDTVSDTLDLQGNVYYSEDDIALNTESASLRLENDEARLRNALFISPTTPIRGRASAVYRDSDYLSRYKDAAYTSCEPGNQDWIVHASDLKINKKDGQGSAKNAWLEFKGVPVFYSPYLSFPTDDRRKSGFLAPVFGNTQKGGFNFSAPFYWNIAPNLDATLRPRYYTARGVLLAGDFRYLTEISKGEVNVEYMPEDTQEKKSRYLASIKNNTQFTKNISSNLDLNIVSEREYFRDLGNALSFSNFSHVKSTADVAYQDEGVFLKGQLVNYQTIDPNLFGRLKPYRRLPQLNLKLNHAFQSLPMPNDIGMETEYVYFQHDDGALPDGHRFNIEPYISLPFQTASAFVTPKFSLQHTQYQLDYPRAGIGDSIGRTLPIASIDAGMFFEKDLNLFGSPYQHTLEPRLYYLYIPRVNQNNIPIFDTSLYDFWFPSLFRDNRYNSIDRIQDANQITAALTSRLVDGKSGKETLRLSVGDIIHFEDRQVVGPVVRVGSGFLNNAVKTSTFSPLVAEMYGRLNDHFGIETAVQWDPEINDIVRGKAYLHFENEPGELINIGYNYRKDTTISDALFGNSYEQIISDLKNPNITTKEQVDALRTNQSVIRLNDIIQTDASFRWPIYDNWFAIGRWQYSLLYNQTQEGFLGFEKENCCWRFRIIGRRYVNNVRSAALGSINSLTQTPSTSLTGIFFQIEFKGLTGIGEKLDDFFVKNIYGYRKPEE